MGDAEKDFVVCTILEQNSTKYSTKSATEVVSIARAEFNTGITKSVAFRRKQLHKLLRMLDENTKAFANVLKQDLHRSYHEALINDVALTTSEVERILSNLDDWMKPTYPKKSLQFWMDVLRVVPEPYGVVLIIGTWNYPLLMTLTPLAAAIAAGNSVVLKPSEVSCATSELLTELLPKYLDPKCYPVYPGGVDETKLLLEQRFDYIFFTGSPRVGRIVHAAANKYLTPVTLELGGKSPVYIDNTADLQIAVRRVLWGKCNNAGQTCVSPDYVLCAEDVQTKFVVIARQVLKEWYGSDVASSECYGRIINDVHFERLASYLKDAKNIAVGGKMDASQRFVEPTILTNVSPNHPVMLDEIFGPILPIVIVKNAEEAVSYINAREKPLALYVFTKQKSIKDLFINKTSSGAVAVNETVLQVAALSLPFGGVGESGMGRYHGRDSFDTFVNRKSVLERGLNPLYEKVLSVRYPPYTSTNTKIMTTMLKTQPGSCVGCFKCLSLVCLGAFSVISLQLILYHTTHKRLI